MNYPLSETAEPIRAALERLVAKAEDSHPFVIVEKVGDPTRFVQYATKKSILFFDSPPLGIYLEPCTIAEGADHAFTAFVGMFALSIDDRVLITEHEDGGPRGGILTRIFGALP